MNQRLRDRVGRAVREAWVLCKREDVANGIPVKDDHLIPWDGLPEREKEVDRRIGETVVDLVLDLINDDIRYLDVDAWE